MINLLLYQHSQDFYNFNYPNGKEDLTVITPNPAMADTIRKILGPSVNAITISRFLNDELKALVDRDILENAKSKSELILFLATIWSSIYPEGSFELFDRSFNLLTDLRSFTLDSTVMKSVLEEYDSKFQFTVLKSHELMEELGIIDEHKSYHLLSERIRQGDLPIEYPEGRNIVIWGFDFLTATQVDLVKSLGIRNEIYIPFPSTVFELANNLDWVTWINGINTNIINVDSHQKSSKKDVEIYEFPNNYLAKTLNEYFKKKPNSPTDIYLSTKRLTIDEVLEIPVSGLYFKINSSMFDSALIKVTSKVSKEMSINEHSVFKIIIEKLKKQAVENQLFKELKVIQCLEKIFLNWMDLSEKNTNVDKFIFKIFCEALKLDLPRISSIPILDKNKIGNIFGVKELWNLNRNKKNIICATSNLGSLKSTSLTYTEEVEKKLIDIGPIKRGELEFLLVKERLCEAMQEDNTVLFIEKGLQKHDIAWNGFLSGLEVKSLDFNPSFSLPSGPNLKIPNETFKLDYVSASRIQTYIDCPRKYYNQYIEKLKVDVKLESSFTMAEIGQIEHEVIGEYCSKFNELNKTELKKVVNFILNKRVVEKNDIPADKIEEISIEILDYSFNGLNILFKLMKTFGANYIFEQNLKSDEENDVRGSIDCFSKANNVNILLDFKRSKAGVPSLKDLKDFNKIQIWLYLQNVIRFKDIDFKLPTVFGYICLAKPEDSVLFSTDEELIQKMKELNLLYGKKIQFFDEKWSDIFSTFDNFLSEIKATIEEDLNYLPNPKDSSACRYCVVKEVCPREMPARQL